MQLQRFKIQCVLILCFSILILTAGDFAYAQAQVQVQTRASVENKIEEAQEILKIYVEENNVPGLSAAIAINNELIWTGGFGYANLQHMVPAGSHTVYRIASISKPIAAVIAMMLVESGALDLDAPIKEYIPMYPDEQNAITMRHLLSHTSGIRHYRGDEFFSNRRYRSVLSPLATFADDTLLFVPGDEYSYTTFGYTLASAVIESAARSIFLDLLVTRIIQPYELHALAPEKSEVIIPNLASFYLRQDGEIYNAPYVDNSNKWAGGGLIATAGELVRFASHLLQGDFIQLSTLEKMFEPQATNDGNRLQYGLGWRIGEDEENGKRVIWHTGGAMGGGGVLLFYPDDGLIYASLANTSGVSHLNLARAITRLFINE